MKRDMELIRLLLLHLESGELPEHKGYSDEEINYNAALAIEAGLIKGEIMVNPTGGRRVLVVAMDRLTWAGHDFLDAARNDTVWHTAKDKVLNSGVAWTFDLLKETLKTLAKQQLARIAYRSCSEPMQSFTAVHMMS